MKALTLILFAGLFFVFSKANALTVDEIIKLKQGGVSDETIQLLIARDSNNRPSSTWEDEGRLDRSFNRNGREPPLF